MTDVQYRLITRGDFDGIVCGGLLYEQGLINDVMFVEPRDVQAGKVSIGPGDITTNLPFVEGVHLCFDHHVSEVHRNESHDSHIIDPDAPSAARVVYNHFGGASGFAKISPDLLDAVDQADSAQYSEDDILAPQGWAMLNFILDPRTGMARHAEFIDSQDSFMREMVHICCHQSLEDIFELPEVQQRAMLYNYHEEFFERQLKRCGEIHGKAVVLDLRDEEEILPGNRFLVYAIYPECNVSIQITHSDDGERTVFGVGKSILDRSSSVNIGPLMLEYGGGGHNAAGTCQVPKADGDRVLKELLAHINADG